MTTIRRCSILEFERGASNQAVAPGAYLQNVTLFAGFQPITVRITLQIIDEACLATPT